MGWPGVVRAPICSCTDLLVHRYTLSLASRQAHRLYRLPQSKGPVEALR